MYELSTNKNKCGLLEVKMEKNTNTYSTFIIYCIILLHKSFDSYKYMFAIFHTNIISATQVKF